jgi:hypothetical protein
MSLLRKVIVEETPQNHQVTKITQKIYFVTNRWRFFFTAILTAWV